MFMRFDNIDSVLSVDEQIALREFLEAYAKRAIVRDIMPQRHLDVCVPFWKVRNVRTWIEENIHPVPFYTYVIRALPFRQYFRVKSCIYVKTWSPPAHYNCRCTLAPITKHLGRGG